MGIEEAKKGDIETLLRGLHSRTMNHRSAIFAVSRLAFGDFAHPAREPVHTLGPQRTRICVSAIDVSGEHEITGLYLRVAPTCYQMLTASSFLYQK